MSESGECRLMTVHSLVKIFSDEGPDVSDVIHSLSVLKNDRCSFQITWRRNSEERDYLRTKVDSPISDYVTVREVRNVPCELPCHIDRDDNYLRTVPGLYPDLLRKDPYPGAAVTAGQWNALWVDIDVPSDAQAGVYSVRLDLTTVISNEHFGTAEVTVEIIDAVLPALDIRHTEWFHTDCIANYYNTEVFSDRYWELTENFMKSARRCSVNMLLTPIFTPPLDTAKGKERTTVQLVDVNIQDGRYSFGFEKLVRWIEMCRRNGFEYLEISHLFSQWGVTAAPKVMGTVDGKYRKIFGWETDASDLAYEDFLSRLLPELTGLLRKYYDPSHVYFHISDEPQITQLQNYSAARRMVGKYLQGFRIMDALSDYNFYRTGAVDIPVCSTNHIKPFLENRPKELWCYYCTAQYKDVANRFIAMPSARNRILGLQLYKYCIDGFLQWGFNFYNSLDSLYPIDPYQTTGSDGTFPSGDPFLVYPGKDGIPEESIRFMVMEEGLSDLRALRLLESMAGREEAMRTADFSKVEFDKYPADAQFLLNARENVNHAIAEAVRKRLNEELAGKCAAER
ncbi:MAG: DUF4091 domain-containing protein [Lachnospiraceae bacterium]|jgi:hypothetical protein|nr:DUF4091 domain-containing protein [Lachnospiraceae bacterium]